MSKYSGTPEIISYREGATISQQGLIFQVACTTVVVWDHISTLDLEVELIWKKKLSLVQLLYFINRYISDILFLYSTALSILVPPLPFIQVRPSLGKVMSWLTVISVGSRQGIMVHRIISMYQYDKKILAGLLSAFFVEFTAAISIGASNSARIKSVPVFYNRTLRVCIPVNWPPWSSVLWFLMIVFDLLIFIMAIWEGLRYRRQLAQESSIRSPEAFEILRGTEYSKEGTLFRILLRDSIVFPFIGFLMILFNALAWYVLPLGALQDTLNISTAGSPILGCRLILNLRDAYYRPFAEEVRYSIKGQEEEPEIVGGHSSSHSSHIDLPVFNTAAGPSDNLTEERR